MEEQFKNFSAEPKPFKYKSTITLLAVALVALGALALWGPKINMNLDSIYKNGSSQIVKLPPGKIPPGLPQDIVLAPNPQITDGYTAVTPNGSKQSTLIYNTEADPSLLISKYAEYFYKSGWTIGSSYLPNMLQNGEKGLAREDKKYILDATKDGSGVNVLILPLPAPSKAWRVSISINTK